MALFACVGCGKIKPGSRGRSGICMPWRCQNYPNCEKPHREFASHYIRKVKDGGKIVLAGNKTVVLKRKA